RAGRQAPNAGRTGRRRGGDPARTPRCIRRANEPARCEGIARAGRNSSWAVDRGGPGLRKAGLHAAGGAGRRSGAEALAALGAATREDLAAVGGLHAGTETVVALALEVAGLVGALGGHGGTRLKSDRKNRKV